MPLEAPRQLGMKRRVKSRRLARPKERLIVDATDLVSRFFSQTSFSGSFRSGFQSGSTFEIGFQFGFEFGLGLTLAFGLSPLGYPSSVAKTVLAAAHTKWWASRDPWSLEARREIEREREEQPME